MYRRFLLIFTLIATAATTAFAFSADSYANQSKLASGKWVKIKTTKEGIYQLSYQQLMELGFSDPTKVQVYGYGATELPARNNEFTTDIPDDVQPTATRHTSDGRILFYGQGDARFRSAYTTDFSRTSPKFLTPVRNTYDTASYYFLSDCQGTSAPTSIPVIEGANSEPLESHIHLDFIEIESQNPFMGSNVFHGPSRVAGETVDYTFHIRDYKPTPKHPNGSFLYKYAIKSPSSMKLITKLPSELTKTDEDHKTYYPPYYSEDYRLQNFDTVSGIMSFKYPTPADSDFTFSVTIPSNSTPAYCAEDYTVLRYPRANRLDAQDPFLIMNFPFNECEAGRRVVFADADAKDLEMWKIDSPLPVVYKASGSGDGSASFVLDGSTSTAISFRPSLTFPTPEIVGDIENQNIHGASTPDMLIITVKELLGNANELAELHRTYQGLDVLVVVHDQVYNEFSSGSRDAMAYRRIAKMFYDRDPQKFKHLLLFGASYYDNRCIISTYADRLVCFEQDNPKFLNNFVQNFPCDTYFGMMNDDYDHEKLHMSRMQINVGRIPSINTGQASKYVAKVRERFENPLAADVYNRVLVTAGHGDSNAHTNQANEMMSQMREVNPGISILPGLHEAYSNSEALSIENITKSLNDGVGAWLYIGHGAPTFIVDWSIGRVSGTQYSVKPFVMFASCDQFSFDHISNGLLESMLFTEGGGALAGYAAARSTYIDFNPLVEIGIGKAYAELKGDATYGDVVRRAHEIALEMYEANPNKYSADDTDTAYCNILSYNLGGDPAIPIGAPGFGAMLTHINSSSVTEGTQPVEPFKTTAFKGVITGLDGAVQNDFNGSVRIEIMDGSRTVNTAVSKPVGVTFDSETLAIGHGEVKNGEFTVKMPVPTPTYPTDQYRMSISADADNGARAMGSFNNLVIGEFDADTFDKDSHAAPSILEMYVGDISFRPGDEVGSSFTLFATIDPSESGLSARTSAIDNHTRVALDGTNLNVKIEKELKRNPDGTLAMKLPITGLADGIHTIDLKLVNNVGLTASRSLDVIITGSPISPEIEIAETVASKKATIAITGVSSIDHARILITDAQGNTVYSTAENGEIEFPYSWNLKDNSGKDVNDGLYKASVLLRSGADYGATPAANIIVLR